MRSKHSLGLILAAAICLALAGSFIYMHAHVMAATPAACHVAQGQPSHGPLQTRPTGPQRTVNWNATPDPHATPQGDSRTSGAAVTPGPKPGLQTASTPCPSN